MGDIYKFSYCTISASSSTSASVGCFFTRDPLLARFPRTTPKGAKFSSLPSNANESQESSGSLPHPDSIRRPLNCNDSVDAATSSTKPPEDLIFRPLQEDLWATEVDNSALSHRAWTVQERMMSPRILHFTKDQLFWECRTAKASETWPEPIRSTKLEIRNVDRLPPDSPGSLEGGGRQTRPGEDNFFSCWSQIVKAYTKADLTFDEDKLVAIAGLARGAILQGRKLGVALHYAAGLWTSTFSREMLWYLDVPALKSIAKYRAPSWSWASVDGEVSYLFSDAGLVQICDVIRIQTIGPGGSLNSPGQVLSGSCRLRGHMMPALGWKRTGRTYSLILPSNSRDGGEGVVWMGDVDYFPDVTPRLPLENAMCLPLVECQYKKEKNLVHYKVCAGLVLQPVDHSLDEYRRVGIFREKSKNPSPSDYWISLREITIV